MRSPQEVANTRRYAAKLIADGLTSPQIQRKTGISRSSLQRLRDAVKRASALLTTAPSAPEAAPAPGIHSWDERKNSAIVTGTVAAEREPHNPEEMVEFARIDLTKWEVERAISNLWHGQRPKDAGTIQLWHVKLYLKRRDPANVDIRVQTREVIAGMMGARARSIKKSGLAGSMFAAVANSGELHLAKKGWAAETGENYDLKIAADRFVRAHAEQAALLKPYQPEELVFRLGDDFYHGEARGTTTAGTPMGGDTRWPKVYREGGRISVVAIDTYRQIAGRVRVLINPGNHDKEQTFCLGEYLAAWYRDCRDVEVVNEPAPRKYYRWGQTLILNAHGNEEKESSYLALMASECPKDFGECAYKEVHLGHLHKQGMKHMHSTQNEDLGVIIQRMSSLSGKDLWHAQKGYGSVPGLDSFVYHREGGRIAHLTPRVLLSEVRA
jgi:hypothetical protein